MSSAMSGSIHGVTRRPRLKPEAQHRVPMSLRSRSMVRFSMGTRIKQTLASHSNPKTEVMLYAETRCTVAIYVLFSPGYSYGNRDIDS